MVVTKTQIGNHNEQNKNHKGGKKVTTKRSTQDRIRAHKLSCSKSLNVQDKRGGADVNTLWHHFKTIVLKATEKICGVKNKQQAGINQRAG